MKNTFCKDVWYLCQQSEVQYLVSAVAMLEVHPEKEKVWEF